MFKTRAKQAEEEAKKEENYRPTEELEAEEEEPNYQFPKTALIVTGVLAVIAIVLIILIFIFKK